MTIIWITIKIFTVTSITITRVSTRKDTNTEAQRSDWTKAWFKSELFKSIVTVTVTHQAIINQINQTNQSKSNNNITDNLYSCKKFKNKNNKNE